MTPEAGANLPSESASASAPEMGAAIPRPSPSRWRRRITLVSGLIALVAAAVVLPPLVNIGRYQRQITALMSNAMGRPVHLSSVGLRLVPRPGFVLNDLTVSEDPSFGAEPVLFARTVVASVGIFPLWRGKLQVTRVSVDEASLNLVRTPQGRWNLESLMMQAQPSLTGNASSAGPRGSAMARHFPYLEATNSRVNLMRGSEKSPFSLVNTDLSLWQDQPGEWRVRLRGQPVRTDMELIWADTGEVRLEGSLRSAAQLRDMPLKLQAEWRDAQLGQLSRLLLGSDAGWRGDLAADIDVQGTADTAQTKARLRVTGVRREEFTPETALDLDANCTLRYQRSQGAVHDIGCDTSIGSGKLHLKGDVPGNGGEPTAVLEVKRVPLQAALDLLRTVRSGLAPGISANGEANGTLEYAAEHADPESTPSAVPPAAQRKPQDKHAKPSAQPAPTLPLRGSLEIDGGVLRGGQLKDPLVLPTITWSPILLTDSAAPATPTPGDQEPTDGLSTALRGILQLESHFSIPLGSPAPLKKTVEKPSEASSAPAPAPPTSKTTQPASNGDLVPEPPTTLSVRLDLGARGYRANINGSATVSRLRDLAYAFGLPRLDAVDALTAGTSDVDLSAAGPWIASLEPFSSASPDADGAAADFSGKHASPPNPGLAQQTDVFSGFVQLHRAQWKASYLSFPAELPQSTVTFAADAVRVNSDFSYGTANDLLKGTVAVKFAPNCKTGDCNPAVQVRFGTLDASAVQAALLGPPTQKSILSPIIDRVRAGDQPKWPAMIVNLTADSLALGSTQLLKPIAQVRMNSNELILESWQASTLGGTAQGTGGVRWADGKPIYSFEGQFSHLNPTAVATLLGNRWKDGSLDGSGKVKLSGLNEKDLISSATGDIQFQWSNGAIVTLAQQPIRFDSWSGIATLKAGKADLQKNELVLGKRIVAVAGTIPLGGPARLTVSATQPAAETAQRTNPPSSKPLR